MRRELKKTIGQEKYDFFFDRFLEYFFTDKDAAFFASLGLNAIRIPFNYRHFESDDAPGVWIEKGFQWLERAVNIVRLTASFSPRWSSLIVPSHRPAVRPARSLRHPRPPRCTGRPEH
jgi:hypothetical protein